MSTSTRNYRNTARRDRRGFSLVEVMVVVVIIGIMSAGIAYIAFSAPDTAKYTRAQSEMSGIKDALENYRLQNNGYPASLEDLKGFQGGRAVGEDPWGNLYEYAPDNDAGVFRLTCKGINEADEADDLIYDSSPDTPGGGWIKPPAMGKQNTDR